MYPSCYKLLGRIFTSGCFVPLLFYLTFLVPELKQFYCLHAIWHCTFSEIKPGKFMSTWLAFMKNWNLGRTFIGVSGGLSIGWPAQNVTKWVLFIFTCLLVTCLLWVSFEAASEIKTVIASFSLTNFVTRWRSVILILLVRDVVICIMEIIDPDSLLLNTTFFSHRLPFPFCSSHKKQNYTTLECTSSDYSGFSEWHILWLLSFCISGCVTIKFALQRMYVQTLTSVDNLTSHYASSYSCAVFPVYWILPLPVPSTASSLSRCSKCSGVNWDRSISMLQPESTSIWSYYPPKGTSVLAHFLKKNESNVWKAFLFSSAITACVVQVISASKGYHLFCLHTVWPCLMLKLVMKLFSKYC